jgi:hypothetical protein
VTDGKNDPGKLNGSPMVDTVLFRDAGELIGIAFHDVKWDRPPDLEARMAAH